MLQGVVSMDIKVANVGRVLPLLPMSLLASEIKDCDPQPVSCPGSWRTATPGPHPPAPRTHAPRSPGQVLTDRKETGRLVFLLWTGEKVTERARQGGVGTRSLRVSAPGGFPGRSCWVPGVCPPPLPRHTHPALPPSDD